MSTAADKVDEENGPDLYIALGVKKEEKTQDQIDLENKQKQEDEEKNKQENELKQKQEEEERQKQDEEKKKKELEEKNKGLTQDQIEANQKKELEEKQKQEDDEKLKKEQQELQRKQQEFEITKAFLKSKGIDIETEEDLANLGKPTPEVDQAKVKEERDAAMLSFGLDKKLFTKAEFENYTKLSDNPREVVFEKFKEKREAEGEKDPAVIEEEFKAYMLEDKPEDNAARKLRESEVGKIAQEILNEKFPKIANLDRDFTEHETAENNKKESNITLTGKAKEYKVMVDTTVSNIKKHSFKMNDELLKSGEHEYEFNYPEEAIKKVTQAFLDQGTFKNFIASGFDKDMIEEAFEAAVIKESLPQMIQFYSRKYGSTVLDLVPKGKRGIVPDRDKSGTGAPGETDEFFKNSPLKKYMPEEK